MFARTTPLQRDGRREIVTASGDVFLHPRRGQSGDRQTDHTSVLRRKEFPVNPTRHTARRLAVRTALVALAGGTLSIPSIASGPAGAPPVRSPRPAVQGQPLPDLMIGEARLRSSLVIGSRNFSANSCSLAEGCVGAAGTRRTLEFDTQIQNLGNADVQLGTPESRPDLFVFSACHGHYHMRDSLDYVLARGGTDSVASYDPTTSVFYLSKTNEAGPATNAFAFGPAGGNLTPLSGDWDGDGDSTPGLYDAATGVFYLRNSNSGGPADMQFGYGPAGLGWQPLTGDWNGDGKDSIGLYDASTGVFYLRNTNNGGPADAQFGYGPAGLGWQPLVGDWDGDDDDTVALYSPQDGVFYLKNTNSGGPADSQFGFGPATAGLKAIAGDWNASGDDTIGLYNPATAVYFLRNTNAGGPADAQFVYGAAGLNWRGLGGDWDYDYGAALPNLGAKQAFCWLDSQRIQGNLSPKYNCGNQGITAGWSDVYGRGLDCQWIDITGLAAGDYQFRVNVNDTHLITTESNYENNTAVLKVRITPSGTREVIPTVDVRQPAGGETFRVGTPVTVRWDVENGQNVTSQEIWLVYPKQKKGHVDDADDPNHDHQAQARILAENIAPGVRSFTFVPTEEFLIDGGQILVRTHDANNLVGTDTRSRGRIAIRPVR